MTPRGSPARRLTISAAANLVHGALGALSAAAAAGLAYRELGAEFGLFALVTVGMVRLNLLDDALGSYLVTAASRRRRGDTAPPIDPQLGAAFGAAIGAAAVFALGLGAAVRLMFAARPDALVLAAIAAAGLVGASAASWAARWLEGQERYVALRAVQSVAHLARLAGVAYLVRQGADVVALVGWYAVVGGATSIVLLGVARAGAGLAILGSLRAARRADLVAVGRFARPLVVARGVAVLSYRLDLWLVQGLVGASGAAAYAIADALAQLLTQALEVFKVVLPVSVQAWHHDDPGWARRFVLGTSKACVFVIGLLCVVVWANLDAVLALWFGEVPQAAVLASRLLVVFVALTAFRSVVQTILVGQGTFGALERSFVIAGLLNVAASVGATLVWGTWGPALGTAVAGGFLVVAVLRAAGIQLALPRGVLERELLARGLVALAAAGALGSVAGGWFATLAAELVVRSAIAGATFALAFWLVALEHAERAWLAARLSGGAAA